MDDKNPDPQLDQLDEPQPTNPDGSPIPPPADSPAPSPADEPAGSGRFAVYDKDELRFYGPVHDTRKSADELKSKLGKDKRRGRYEVREV